MKRFVFCCFLSGVVGAGVALAMYEGLLVERLDAQELGQSPTAGNYRPAVGIAPQMTRLPPEDLTTEEQVNIAVYENVNRSVVNISTKAVQTDAFFFLDVESEGMGSGSVLDKAGHVLTNCHVIEGAKEVNVALFNGKTLPARVVGKDVSSDVAVLQIDAPPDMLFPVTIGDSTRLRVGQRAFAIGNPFGLERTLTTGIVSSLNRTLPIRKNLRLRSIIQIDAAINPGNSGGPLLDSRGRLIGMNTAIASKTGQSTGVGFAIPASTISRVVPQLIETGRVVRADAGIVPFETEEGVLIGALAKGGPGEQAGLRGPQIRRDRRRQGPFVVERTYVDRAAGDLIVSVDGVRIATADEFLTAIENRRPGDEVRITVSRQGQESTVVVRLADAS